MHFADLPGCPARPLVRLSRAIASALIGLAVVAAPARAQAPPADRATAIVVLDGSNSMNGRLPGDRALKYQSVREALRASLPGLAGTEVGLAAFGHRRSGDCNDAEVVVQPTADVGRVLGALDRLQPRGFSPVALAVRTAARALPQGAAKSSIVLVLDDLASCRSEDPCAVASELKRQNAALAIHVVVLGPRPADLPVLACMVRETGGQLFQVRDAAGVVPAIEEALKVASLERRSTPAPVAAASPAPVSPAGSAQEQQRAAPAGLGIDLNGPGLHLTANLGVGAPIVITPINWRIWAAAAVRAVDTGNAAQRREGVPIVEATAPAISRVLPNGRYEVEASAGLVTVRRQIEITGQNATPITMNLDAALLAISAPMAKATKAAPDTTIAVHAVGTGNGTDGGRPAGTALWIGRGGRSDLVVPAGSYRVRASAGLASAERVVTAGSGIAAEIELPLNAGRLVLDEQAGAGRNTGRNRGGMQIVLEADDPEDSAGRRELYRSAGGRLDLVVPAGSYLMSLRKDGAEVRERYIIKPGDMLVRQITVPIVSLRLAGTLGRTAPTGLPLSYRVERIDASARVLRRWGESEPVLWLNPGRYRIEARVGAQNAVAVREVELRASPSEQRLDMDVGAGRVQLKLASAGSGLGFGEVYWQIQNERGESIWRTGQAEPVLALAAGRYVVKADSREHSHERTFEVRNGDNVTIEVGE